MIRRAVLVALLGLVGFGSLPRAEAQIPPLPEEAEIVLQVISPIVSPTCANAGLAVVLLPTFIATVPVPVPSEFIRIFGPVVTVCGLFPAPEQRIACPLDDTLASIVNEVGVALLGQALPVDVRVVGPVFEVVNEVTSLLTGVQRDLASNVVTTIGCREVDLAPEPDAGNAIPDLPTPAPTITPVVTVPVSISPAFEVPTAIAPRPAAPVIVSQPAASRPGPVAGFDYPVVFGLPLALLALATFLGWIFTRPVDQ